jgi:predicted nucleic acid-binding protein
VVSFIDTNILVYAHDRSDATKHTRARELIEGLWDDGSGVLSTQVLQELYAVATSRWKLAMTHAEARELVALYAQWRVIQVEPSLILTASRVAEEHGLSIWDALILESARVAGASHLLTEDLQDGASISGVRIENPFR